MSEPQPLSLARRIQGLSLRVRIFLFFALIGAAIPVAFGGAMVVANRQLAADPSLSGGDTILTATITAVLGLMALVVVVGYLFDTNVSGPLQALIRDMEIIAHANPAHRPDFKDGRYLGMLPAATRDLAIHLADARNQTQREIAQATDRVQEQKSRLEALLRDLHEGVVMCNPNHQILLYNKVAQDLVRGCGDIGLGRALFALVGQESILHALDRLTNRFRDGRHATHVHGLTTPFIAATADGRTTLEARMSLMVSRDNVITGYVVTFSDVTDELSVLDHRDRLLRQATEGMRAPLANLRAASENLTTYDDIPGDLRREFEKVIITEAQGLSERVETLCGKYRKVITGHWPMADVFSANLLNLVLRRLSASDPAINAQLIGPPYWLHGDSHSLVEAISHLIRQVHQTTDTTEFELETVIQGDHVGLDLIWNGPAIPPMTLSSWLTHPLTAAPGKQTLGDVLEHHKSDLWCQQKNKPGDADRTARLHMPLPAARQRVEVRDLTDRPTRSEFYDFSLLNPPDPNSSITDHALRELTFVVFDTETTGLESHAGDEMISIAGVRIVNSRILSGETFDQLINPGRSIPAASIRFHGITDDMVRDAPSAQKVVPLFHDFVQNAVLVAHNAAFDMQFLRMKERASGVTFTNPTIDTLLLSAFLHGHATRHTLDDVAKRLGVEISGRHTALGDSLATAGVLLKMLDLLESRGVHTLGDAVNACRSMV